MEHPNKTSNITFCFGDPISTKCPTQLNGEFIVNSAKIKNMKFNITQYLNTDVPEGSILMELSTDDDAQQIANLMNKLLKEKGISENLANKNINVKIFGKNQKIFILIISDPIADALKTVGEKVVGNYDGQADLKILKFNIKSMRTLDEIKNDMENRDPLIAWLTSLEFGLSFHKADFQLYKNLINPGNNLSIGHIEKLFKSFQHFNLRVKGQSGNILESFQKLLQPLKKPLTTNLDCLQNKLNNTLKCYAFGDKLAVSMIGEFNNIQLLLDMLLS